ncbi:MAG: autotransporter domain-containing protein [Opitutaceae bacterium]|nr:autotransporter domain-containing protein [Opitutaceae bacterium]
MRAGAALDLGGFAQTARDLSGAGGVTLGSAALTVDSAAGSSFAGAIAGAGRLVKTGAGKLSLTGSSAYAGGTELAAGTLGIGHDGALGAGALTVTAAGAKLSADASGITIANAINLGAHGLEIDSAHDAVFSGSITGAGALAVHGAGVTTLSGAGGFGGGLVVGAARLVAGAAAAIGTGAVAIAPGSTLEFRGAASGAVNNALSGGTVEFTDSTLEVGGANTLLRFIVGPGAKVTAASAAALGGAASAVSVGAGGRLDINPLGTVAGSIEVKNGGKLIFNPAWRENSAPMLAVDSAVLEDGATIGFGSFVSGNYLLLQATGTLSVGQNITFEPGPNVGLDVAYFKIDPDAGAVSFGALNYVANPGKDIAALFDAMTAAGNAIHSRLGEGFLFAPDRAGGSVWIKGVGSYASYDGNTGPSDYARGTVNSNAGKTGYTNDTYGVVAGFDRKISGQFLAGAYLGCLSNRIRTEDRLSENDGTLPFGGAYGALRLGAVYLAADLMFGDMDADTSRFEQTGHAIGAYKTSVHGAGIEAGAILGSWDKGSIRPAAALHYTGVRYRGQRETGPGSVLIDSFDNDYLETLVSLQVMQEVTLPWKKTGVIDGRIGWRGSLKDSPVKTTGRFLGGAPDENFAIAVDNYNRNGLLIGLGLRFGLTAKSDFSLGYDFELGGEFDRHTLDATVRFAW